MSFLEKMKKPTETEEEAGGDMVFMRNIITSFFAIVMCIIMLGASTYAWFTTSIQSTQTISSAVYVLNISVKCKDTEMSYQTVDGNRVYTFEAGETYTVTAKTGDGTTARTGYLKLKVGDNTYISQQIDCGDAITFTIEYTEETEVTFIEGWGTSSAEVRDLIGGGNYENLK